MITILCGRVAVGKSTVAQHMHHAYGALHLSCDDLMLTLFDGCLGETHDQTALRCLQYLCTVAHNAAQSGLDCVLDYGFWLRAERDTVRAYFATHELAYRLVWVDVAQEIRLARLAQRNEALRACAQGKRVYLIEGALLERMDAKFEPPTPEECAQLFDNTAQPPDVRALCIGGA